MALMSSGRYLLLIVLIVLSSHFLLSLTHDTYTRATSWSRLRQPQEYYTYNQTLDVKFRDKANATFIILARNSDMDNAVRSMRCIEDRFNTWHHYPCVYSALSLSSAALPLLVPPFPSTPRSAPSRYSVDATLSAFRSGPPLRPLRLPHHVPPNTSLGPLTLRRLSPRTLSFMHLTHAHRP
ncbi:hypothetical protein C8J57DRAFT_1712392 [Mycena rebaudengoi]|nr:hypothetical protein C8J57DRAFT_1712392 [Mycena rebaudengoi]